MTYIICMHYMCIYIPVSRTQPVKFISNEPVCKPVCNIQYVKFLGSVKITD